MISFLCSFFPIQDTFFKRFDISFEGNKCFSSTWDFIFAFFFLFYKFQEIM